MELFDQYHQIAGFTLARIFLGLLFFFQGFDAVFKVKIKNMVQTYEGDFAMHHIPRFLTKCASWFTSCTELIGGLLLILGLFEYVALYLLGINLLVAAIGFGINAPMWDTKYVFPRLVLLLFLLLAPAAWNSWSFDNLVFKP